MLEDDFQCSTTPGSGQAHRLALCSLRLVDVNGWWLLVRLEGLATPAADDGRLAEGGAADAQPATARADAGDGAGGPVGASQTSELGSAPQGEGGTQHAQAGVVGVGGTLVANQPMPGSWATSKPSSLEMALLRAGRDSEPPTARSVGGCSPSVWWRRVLLMLVRSRASPAKLLEFGLVRT